MEPIEKKHFNIINNVLDTEVMHSEQDNFGWYESKEHAKITKEIAIEYSMWLAMERVNSKDIYNNPEELFKLFIEKNYPKQ